VIKYYLGSNDIDGTSSRRSVRPDGLEVQLDDCRGRDFVHAVIEDRRPELIRQMHFTRESRRGGRPVDRNQAS